MYPIAPYRKKRTKAKCLRFSTTQNTIWKSQVNLQKKEKIEKRYCVLRFLFIRPKRKSYPIFPRVPLCVVRA